jgi:hypothetical protein
MTENSLQAEETGRQPLGRFDVLAVLALFIPSYFIIVLINRYAINVPYWDIWDWSVRRFAFDVGYNLRDLWGLTNEHRMVFPQIIDLMIANATSLDIIPRIYAKVPFAVVITIVLYFLYRMKGTSPLVFGFAIPISLLSFSLSYWPAWVDPNPLASHLSILTFILALMAITGLKIGWRALSIAAAATFVSSLSYASGNASWVVIFALLYVKGYRKRQYFIVWALLALSVLIPYVLDIYQSTTVIRTVRPAGLLDLGKFILTFIGAPLSANNTLIGFSASVLGLLGVLGVFVLSFGIKVHIKDGVQKMIPWLTLIVWVLLNAGAAALGRSGKYGTEGAAVWRYAHIQTLFWIGIAALIAILLTEPHRNFNREKQINFKNWLDVIAIILTLVIGVGYMNANLYKIQNNRLEDQSHYFAAARECLLNYELASDNCLRQLYPDPDRIRRYMPRLIERGALFIYDPELKFATAIIETEDPRWIRHENLTLEDTTHEVIFQHPPSEITWQLNLQQRYKKITLRTGMIILMPDHHDASPSDGVLFRISVIQDDQEQEMFAELILPTKQDNGFQLVDIDLSKYAGEVVKLSFSTSPGLDASYHANYDWAYWLYPELDFK